MDYNYIKGIIACLAASIFFQGMTLAIDVYKAGGVVNAIPNSLSVMISLVFSIIGFGCLLAAGDKIEPKKTSEDAGSEVGTTGTPS